MTAYTAAAAFYRVVRNFAQTQPAWAQRLEYEVKPDEKWDVTKVARRVYGDPDEFLAIMAAAGMDSVEHPLTARRLILPTAQQLAAMKERTGYTVDQLARTKAEAADPVGTR